VRTKLAQPGQGAKLAATFARRELREACGWSLTQVRAHLERLVELEYLELRHGRLGSAFVYELMLDANAPEHALHLGLIDVAELRKLHDYDGKKGGGTLPLAGFAPGVAGQNGRVAAGGETPSPPLKPKSTEEETAA